ncbi:MAG: tRNA pseudouridine(13) synthase TruD [Methanobacteriota archaeon]|nr:MAG: tRNA pseudouridine(13) synthase TruD [Euryarchaeota archaeon]
MLKKLDDFLPAPMTRSKKPRVEIKKRPEDFIVEEVPLESPKLSVSANYEFTGGEGKFLHAVLVKKNWSTDMALKRICRLLGVSKKRADYAGTKDKRAWTAQLFSLYSVDAEKLSSLSIRDVKLFPLHYADKPIKMGDLRGNAFTIAIDSYSRESLSELNGKFPNYYGEQRFGNSGITHKVGYLMLKGMYEEAVMLFLTERENEKNEEAKEARALLKEHGDFKRALNEFPYFLRHERTILGHLSNKPNDYVNALRRLPRGTLLMFIHAVQSFLFNKYLEKRITIEGLLEDEYMCSSDKDGFPIIDKEGTSYVVAPVIGYESSVNNLYKEVLSSLDLSKEDFLIKSMPELSSRGTKRLLFSPILNLIEGNPLSFTLPSGSYATVFLREIISY